MSFQIPKGYASKLTIRETERGIKAVKDQFERSLANKLSLNRISAPLFVFRETGLNDDLNGVERPVRFSVKNVNEREVDIVHSLAKWKRAALHKYGYTHGEGIYTDMNAIRRDDDLDNIHSIYVDQWDWERIIAREERTIEMLQTVVTDIFAALKETEAHICSVFPQLTALLPEKVTFITSQALLDMYPDLDAKGREDAACREHGAIFVMQIGGALSDGERHDGRAPDYDDWSLNGDLLLWYPVLGHAFEITSMGIRVDKGALLRQLDISGHNDRLELPYHKAIVEEQLPLTIGGGIGQSRLCMFLMNKAHIGEVHASIWPEEMIAECEQNGIYLL